MCEVCQKLSDVQISLSKFGHATSLILMVSKTCWYRNFFYTVSTRACVSERISCFFRRQSSQTLLLVRSFASFCFFTNFFPPAGAMRGEWGVGSADIKCVCKQHCCLFPVATNTSAMMILVAYFPEIILDGWYSYCRLYYFALQVY